MQAKPFTAEERKSFLGGSDIGVIMGANPYKSPYELWLEKTGEIEPMESNRFTRFGEAMEDHIKREAEERTGLKWRKVRKRFRHPMLAFLVGHVDGLNKESVLEVKCTKSMNRKDFGSDGAEFSHWEFGNVQMCPPSHFWQMQTYMLLTGKDRCYYAVGLRDDAEVRVMLCLAQQTRQRELMEAASAFWELVQKREEPPFLCAADLDYKYPKDNQLKREATAEELQIIDRYKQLGGMYQESRDLVLELKSKMGETAVLLCQDKPLVTWKTQERNTLDTKALKAAHPEICDEFMRKSETRVFKI
jgi:putative phage-type endonuclease